MAWYLRATVHYRKNPEKGCVVPQGVQDHHANASAAAADVVCPNVLELGVMTGTEPSSPSEVLAAARGGAG